MPLPEPRSGESEDDFISRCMSNDTAIEDFPEQDQRLGVCFNQFRRGKTMVERKVFSAGAVEVKDAVAGIVTARFATMGVKDHDGDVTDLGAFGSQDVRVSSFGHGSWMGELPVGKGVIYEKGEAALADLKFFMDTQTGREHFEVVKGLGDLGEWSYGFDILQEAAPDEDQREKGIVRVLQKLLVHEVSPVLKGAGIGTGTLAVKAAERPPEAKKQHRLACMHCATFLGEASSGHVFVGMTKNRRAAEGLAALPRDMRMCKRCGRFNVFIPESALTAS